MVLRNDESFCFLPAEWADRMFNVLQEDKSEMFLVHNATCEKIATKNKYCLSVKYLLQAESKEMSCRWGTLRF